MKLKNPQIWNLWFTVNFLRPSHILRTGVFPVHDWLQMQKNTSRNFQQKNSTPWTAEWNCEEMIKKGWQQPFLRRVKSWVSTKYHSQRIVWRNKLWPDYRGPQGVQYEEEGGTSWRLSWKRICLIDETFLIIFRIFCYFIGNFFLIGAPLFSL